MNFRTKVQRKAYGMLTFGGAARPELGQVEAIVR
jgi:hypothetical protein